MVPNEPQKDQYQMRFHVSPLGKRPVQSHLNVRLLLRNGHPCFYSTSYKIDELSAISMAIKNFQKHNAKMDLFSSFRQALNISWQRIMSFSEACQNSPGFTLTHQTHLQECWLVHMWHVRK